MPDCGFNSVPDRQRTVKIMDEPTPNRLAELVGGRPTYSEIAAEAGVSVSLISKVAAGTRRPSDRVKAAASKVLGLSARMIFPNVEE
jgi:transcriptional regulator with XRE-family HTH domain